MIFIKRRAEIFASAPVRSGFLMFVPGVGCRAAGFRLVDGLPAPNKFFIKRI